MVYESVYDLGSFSVVNGPKIHCVSKPLSKIMPFFAFYFLTMKLVFVLFYETDRI